MFDAAHDRFLETKVTDLRLPFRIGILPAEKLAAQPVVINISMVTDCPWRHDGEDIARYVSYADVVDKVKRLAASGGHVNLVETLAEKICDFALEDARVIHVRVEVTKPTIIPEAAGVGVTLRRTRRS